MDIPQWIQDLPPVIAALISALIAVFSLFVASLALILNGLNYRRDRAKVTVKLQWNAEITQADTRSGGGMITERWAHIYVTNERRRSVFITDVGLDLPGRNRTINRLAEGRKLSEGDEPIIIRVPQDASLEPFQERWREIYASAGDSTGRQYTSKKDREAPILTGGINQKYAKYTRDIHVERLPSGSDTSLSRPDVAWYKRRPWTRNRPPNS